MGCPRIFLVRHGESLSNLDKKVHLNCPDHAIGLSDLGKEQADRAGQALAKSFTEHWDKTHGYRPGDDTCASALKGQSIIWTSPYTRTRQTTEGILKHLPGFTVKEHINLVEQQFGLFDGLSDEELAEKYPKEYAHYDKCEKFEGKFWARMPLGESRFDVAVRVHQFFGTMMRDYDRHHIENIIIVSHGVTNRAFTMQWLHKPFEWFEKEPNPKNCSIRLIEGDKDYGYVHSGG